VRTFAVDDVVLLDVLLLGCAARACCTVVLLGRAAPSTTTSKFKNLKLKIKKNACARGLIVSVCIVHTQP